MEHPAKIKILDTMTKEVKNEVIQPFHLPSHFSTKSVNGSFIPEISASSLVKVVNPCRALVIVPVGTVLFDIYVQHKIPITMQTPPFSANIKSNASQFS
jgi:hypothetical protein